MRRTLLAAVLLPFAAFASFAQTPNTSPPSSPVKLVFIHHSTGENWLRDDNGGLGLALRAANLFVSDTNYGWGPADADLGSETIGDHTDIGNFWQWFSGPHRDTYLAALFAESGQHSEYTRRDSDPGGPNRIVMWKSCFPNARLSGSPADPVPPIASNPLRGQDASSDAMTVANAKGIYVEILRYFATRPDVLFVLVVNPPLGAFETDAAAAANARALADWLVNDWLRDYTGRNVAVFDFFDVLTSNGGSTRTNDPHTNDFGWTDGNHHRIRNGAWEHLKTVAHDMSAYVSGEDSHPTQAGNLKATGEFVPLLLAAYHCWQGDGGCVSPASGSCAITSCGASGPGAATAGSPVSFSASVAASGCTGSVSYDWDFGDGGAHGSGASPAHTYQGAGSYGWSMTATVDGQSCVRTGTVSVTAGGGGGAYRYVLGAVAHSAGAGGTFWTTDVSAVNRGTAPASVALTFVPVSGQAATRGDTVPGSGAREWADVLSSLFGYPSSAGVSGALLLAADQPLVVASRTQTPGGGGSYGGCLPGVDVTAGGLAAGQTGVLPQLKKNAAFRTNVGVTNLGTASVSASVRLFGASGSQVGGTRTFTVPPGALLQESDIFTLAGAGSQDVAYATVTVETPGGRAWAFASVIDEKTGDPTLVPLVGP